MKLLIKRLFGWLGDIVLFVIGLSVCAIGIYSSFPWKWPENSDNVTIILLGLLMIASVIERRIALNNINQNLLGTGSRLLEIETKIENLGEEKVQFIENRDELFIKLRDALRSLPDGSDFFVTHFEKLRYPFSHGEPGSDIERVFMEEWFDKAQHIAVRQVIHLSTQQEIEEVENRIQTFERNSDYRIAAIYGPPSYPFIDLIGSHTRFATITLSTHGDSPMRADAGIVVSDEKLIALFRQAFDVIWNYATILKGRDYIDEKEISRLKTLLPVEWTQGRQAASLQGALQLGQSSTLSEILRTILAESASLSRADVDEVFKRRRNELLRDVSRQLTELQAGRYNLLEEDFGAMLEIMRTASRSIDAVSSKNIVSFWTSQLGQRYLSENAGAVRGGVVVRRIFACRRELLADETFRKILSAQANVGIEVYICFDDNELLAGLKVDFAICDDKIAFIDDEATNRVTMNERDIDRLRRRFENILLVCIPYGEIEE